ncbi:MAG: flagellar basal body L-ring protein FlgH [Desulfobacteraceae bacterium]|nr:MAG: flagellar basal body L-ring protein FlgH [Desulfobacteraceae bacterium]
MYQKHRALFILQYSFFSCSVVLALFGCASNIREVKPAKEYIPREVHEEPPIKYEGSLWHDNGPLSDLFINPKARRVGDIITVKIVESSKASNKASTNAGRNSSISAGIDNFFGLEQDYPSSRRFFSPFGRVKADFESAFDGKGTTTRSGDLTAYITARVTEVLPSGNLQIAGSREVTVNNERQFITLSGIVRPRDISPGNVILSTYISDARIAYSGVGIIDDRQRPGWMTRILNTIWPF